MSPRVPDKNAPGGSKAYTEWVYSFRFIELLKPYLLMQPHTHLNYLNGIVISSKSKDWEAIRKARDYNFRMRASTAERICSNFGIDPHLIEKIIIP